MTSATGDLRERRRGVIPDYARHEKVRKSLDLARRPAATGWEFLT